MKIYLKVSLLILIINLVLSSCSKDNESNFTAGFSYEFQDDNTVLYTNTSTGEYYSLTWDFGKGDEITTSDKKQTFQIHYPLKGDYTVSLKVLDYSGVTKTSSKQINIAKSDLPELIATFTAEPTQSNPNYVLLTNTTEGEYDSFKWLYRDEEITDENEHLAYFPLAGDYEIELQIFRGEDMFTSSQTITIDEDDDDPNLIWSDEFDYSGLPDASFWNMETGGGGWGNNELQYYTNSENNAQVSDGVLTITAREENINGYDYSSARITTQNKFDFKYGRIEARMKLPYGQGIWPAFWMLGTNINSVGWPACGEIDIMEMIGGSGRENTVYTTLHWDNAGSHSDYGEAYTLSSGMFSDDFHVFSVEWDSQTVRGYVDGNQFYNISITSAELSEFQQNFFVILNIAVGGSWPGYPDATTEFPQTMKVDYVRVYKN